jgi:polyisoprenoid-binding protein YceI
MWTRLSVLLACAAGFLHGEFVTYELRPAQGARFALTVEKTGLMRGKKHVFVFGAYKGTLLYDPDSPEHSRVDLFVRADSAVCMDKWVSEKDLKKIQAYALNDMLAADRYPELHFSSVGAVRKDENTFEVTGMLTIRGIRKPATIIVSVSRNSGTISSLSGHSVVRLKDYGLKPPTAALGAIGTRNEMTVEFSLAPAIRPAQPLLENNKNRVNSHP